MQLLSIDTSSIRRYRQLTDILPDQCKVEVCLGRHRTWIGMSPIISSILGKHRVGDGMQTFDRNVSEVKHSAFRWELRRIL